MHDVFLSYASESRDQVRALVEELEHRGLDVWWDRQIDVGQSYDSRIDDAIRESRAVVVAWTHAALESQWVTSEALDGQERGILVPVLLEDVRMPVAFRRVQAAKLIDWPRVENEEEFNRFMSALDAVLARGGRPTTRKLADDATDSTLSVRVAKRVLDALIADRRALLKDQAHDQAPAEPSQTQTVDSFVLEQRAKQLYQLWSPESLSEAAQILKDLPSKDLTKERAQFSGWLLGIFTEPEFREGSAMEALQELDPTRYFNKFANMIEDSPEGLEEATDTALMIALTTLLPCGFPSQALTLLNACERILPLEVDVLFGKAWALAQLDDPAQAIATLESAIRLFPTAAHCKVLHSLLVPEITASTVGWANDVLGPQHPWSLLLTGLASADAAAGETLLGLHEPLLAGCVFLSTGQTRQAEKAWQRAIEDKDIYLLALGTIGKLRSMPFDLLPLLERAGFGNAMRQEVQRQIPLLNQKLGVDLNGFA